MEASPCNKVEKVQEGNTCIQETTWDNMGLAMLWQLDNLDQVGSTRDGSTILVVLGACNMADHKDSLAMQNTFLPFYKTTGNMDVAHRDKEERRNEDNMEQRIQLADWGNLAAVAHGIAVVSHRLLFSGKDNTLDGTRAGPHSHQCIPSVQMRQLIIERAL